MACFSLALLYMFFYLVLPAVTKQGKLVQVPDLTSKKLDELDAYLKQHRLNYVITDTVGYSDKISPFAVLQQFPSAGVWVKEARKIYLTLNAEHPPLVPMPNLLEGSIRQAQLLLTNKKLKLGNISYVPDVTQHTVLEQWHNGKPIAAGQPIHWGAVIDLVVAAGLGKQMVTVPTITERPLEEAHLLLLEQGMRVGVVHRIQDPRMAVGRVVQQNPSPDTKVPLGTVVHVWVTDCYR